MTKHAPKTLEELKQARKPVRNINIEHYKKLGRLDKLALFATEHIGTVGFFLIILIWTVLWLGWNIFAAREWRFDPYPAFFLWVFISNMLQLMLMPLIMIGQNLQGQHSEARAEADFNVDVKVETEIETVLQHLENQNELIFKILNHLESDKKR